MLFLFAIGFLAGMMDSCVGAGGLLQIPALILVFPGTTVVDLLGIHKFASMVGTGVSVHQYARSEAAKCRPAFPMIAPAFIGALIGARMASIINSDWMRLLLLCGLVAMASFTFFRKDFGTQQTSRLKVRNQQFVVLCVGLGLGLYDGCIGLGAGSLFLFAFIAILGLDFIDAAASARLLNLATNIAAVLVFSTSQHIIYKVAIPLAIFNLMGAFVGTKLAIAKGSPLIRKIFIGIVTALALKLALDIWRRHFQTF